MRGGAVELRDLQSGLVGEVSALSGHVGDPGHVRRVADGLDREVGLLIGGGAENDRLRAARPRIAAGASEVDLRRAAAALLPGGGRVAGGVHGDLRPRIARGRRRIDRRPGGGEGHARGQAWPPAHGGGVLVPVEEADRDDVGLDAADGHRRQATDPGHVRRPVGCDADAGHGVLVGGGRAHRVQNLPLPPLAVLPGVSAPAVDDVRIARSVVTTVRPDHVEVAAGVLGELDPVEGVGLDAVAGVDRGHGGKGAVGPEVRADDLGGGGRAGAARRVGARRVVPPVGRVAVGEDGDRRVARGVRATRAEIARARSRLVDRRDHGRLGPGDRGRGGRRSARHARGQGGDGGQRHGDEGRRCDDRSSGDSRQPECSTDQTNHEGLRDLARGATSTL